MKKQFLCLTSLFLSLLIPSMASSTYFQENPITAADCQQNPSASNPIQLKIPTNHYQIELNTDCKNIVLKVLFADGTVTSRQITFIDSPPLVSLKEQKININEILNPQRDNFETSQEFQKRRKFLLDNRPALIASFNQTVQQHPSLYRAGYAFLAQKKYNINSGMFPVQIEWHNWAKVFDLPEKASIRIARNEARALWQEGYRKPVYVYLENENQQITVSKQVLVGLGKEWVFGHPLPTILHTTLQGHEKAVYSVAFSPDGHVLASGSQDGTIKLWEISTGYPFNSLQGHRDSVNSIAFSLDGKFLASGSKDKTVKLWNLTSGEVLYTRRHRENVTSVAFNPQGNILASGSEDNTIKLWDLKIGKLLHTLHGHEEGVLSIAFSPDGRILASGGKGRSIKLWEVNSGQVLRILQEEADRVWSLAFSPNGKFLASGSGDNSLKLWEINTGQELYALPGHGNLVSSLAFSPDGRILVSGSRDSTIKLWDIQTGKQLDILQQHGNAVLSVAFSPDGHFLASGSKDKTIKLWGP